MELDRGGKEGKARGKGKTEIREGTRIKRKEKFVANP